MDKVRVIEWSLRCYEFGHWAFLPGLGLVPATAAIVLYYQVRQEARNGWNPAAREARHGCLLAGIGLVLNAGVLGLVWALWIRQLS